MMASSQLEVNVKQIWSCAANMLIPSFAATNDKGARLESSRVVKDTGIEAPILRGLSGRLLRAPSGCVSAWH